MSVQDASLGSLILHSEAEYILTVGPGSRWDAGHADALVQEMYLGADVVYSRGRMGDVDLPYSPLSDVAMLRGVNFIGHDLGIRREAAAVVMKGYAWIPGTFFHLLQHLYREGLQFKALDRVTYEVT